jgi:hypothetical protein
MFQVNLIAWRRAVATDPFLHCFILLVVCCRAALVDIVIDHQLKITSIKENKY